VTQSLRDFAFKIVSPPMRRRTGASYSPHSAIHRCHRCRTNQCRCRLAEYCPAQRVTTGPAAGSGTREAGGAPHSLLSHCCGGGAERELPHGGLRHELGGRRRRGALLRQVRRPVHLRGGQVPRGGGARSGKDCSCGTPPAPPSARLPPSVAEVGGGGTTATATPAADVASATAPASPTPCRAEQRRSGVAGGTRTHARTRSLGAPAWPRPPRAPPC